MPSKLLKKSVNKRKQNGKKVTKGQALKTKQKYEMETSPKEQMSELEKEIFSIKINEFESKLGRKKRLCSYMEEEINIYKTLYDEKQLLKSESMKLLNNAFEDFSTEIFLLDQELNTMQYNYDQILKEQKFCESYKEKVEKLSLLEEKLGKKMLEAEKCTDEIPSLIKKLENLQTEAFLKKEKFLCEEKNIITEFEICLQSIEEELICTTNKLIEDNGLKLDLLPIPYKALFLSGLLSNSWLESVLNYCGFLQSQNSEMNSKCNELQLSAKEESEKLKELFSCKSILSMKAYKRRKDLIPLDVKEFENVDVVVYADKELKFMLQFKRKILQQQDKVENMKAEIEKLENAIKSLEVSGETCFDKSYLIQVICKAGSILKEEL